ncbi:hypothetical protein [Tropicibacter alexandrii]|uniref:hypothetical protein n=1 Tax=Tropicibacter alexandrii TaxID=2267683 RepID=UPI000EF4A7A8|nr:hypothetical protein [Tropicibacter alexandrii]
MRNMFRMAAAASLCLAGSSAFAWGDMYMGDGTNDPNSNFLVHSYNATNYCPQGLQPVLAGGVICCGVPNAGHYVDRPGKAHYKPTKRYYTPEGEKGVVYR